MEAFLSVTTAAGQVRVPVRRFPTVIVGSGAAALSAAAELGETAALCTEGMQMGASRNTGSDKQTYYKLATGLTTPDSAFDMAEDLFACGSMHGDLALVEAAGSLRAFYRLVSLGVPFPHDRYGEYTGYRTDHDTHSRATSCGPLTSRRMVEALEAACRSENVPVFDGYRAVRVLTVPEPVGKREKKAVGILCISKAEVCPENPAGLAVFFCGALVWATGGPSALYENSVYPESQTGSLGAPLLAGADAVNLTESQYGVASTPFRWNLSGSYQQVIPRYVSVDPNDPDGGEREFLTDVFPEDELPNAVFSKGYEWPFDPEKLTNSSQSSKIDLAVYRECCAGRRVYLDFRRECSAVEKGGLTRQTLGERAFSYLEASGALCPTPVARLRAMNENAYQLFLEHGIDLETDLLECRISAQHMNGGLGCDIWYENPVIANLYPVGECAGVFGVKRPGGSALNSTQVGSLRAAEKIRAMAVEPPETLPDALADTLRTDLVRFSSRIVPADGSLTAADIDSRRHKEASAHDACAAFVRNPAQIRALLEKTKAGLAEKEASLRDADALLADCLRRDVLVTRVAVLSAILTYIDDGGTSRGSYLIGDGSLPLPGTQVVCDTVHRQSVLVTRLTDNGEDAVSHFERVRPIPRPENWFETVYNTGTERFSEDETSDSVTVETYTVLSPSEKGQPDAALEVTRVLPADGKPRFAVQLLHGISEHKGRYLPFMRAIAKAGGAAIMHDSRGFGPHSDTPGYAGALGYHYETLCGDVDLVYRSLAEMPDPCDRYAPADLDPEKLPKPLHALPRFLFGHSMGALMASLYTAQSAYRLDGLILSGLPHREAFAGLAHFGLGIEELFTGDRRCPKSLNRKNATFFNADFEPEPGSPAEYLWLSNDPGNRARFREDTACTRPLSLNIYRNLLRMVRDVYRPASWDKTNPELPVLMQAGECDPVAGGKRQAEYGARFFRDMGFENVTVRRYDGGRHEIYFDADWEAPLSDLLAFLESGIPAALERRQAKDTEYVPAFDGKKGDA